MTEETEKAKPFSHMVHFHEHDNSDHNYYAYGYCHALALALHQEFGFSLTIVIDEQNGFYWENPDDEHDYIEGIIHVYAVDENDLAWDISGARHIEHLQKDIDDEYGIESSIEHLCRADDVFNYIKGRKIFATQKGLEYAQSRYKDYDNRPLRGITREDIKQAKETTLFDFIRTIRNAN